MKKTIAILILSVVLFSCKKEKIQVFTDIELNQKIDQKIFDGIRTLSNSELNDLSLQKEIVLRRILKVNPKISLKQLYPKMMATEAPVYLAKDICLDNFNNSIASCNMTYVGTCLVSVISAVAVGTFTFGLGGVAVGTVGVAVNTLAYKACSDAVWSARKECERKR